MCLQLLSPEISIISSQQLPFSDFLENFKQTLKNVYHESENMDEANIQRGMKATSLDKIMSCNPLSVSIPSNYGGRGIFPHEILEILTAASYESLALSLTLGINMALFLQPVAKYGKEEVKPAIFRRFLEDKNMGGLMITEPNFGSDALSMQTAYVEKDGHYHIQGLKHWGGLTGMADYWLLTARQRMENGGLNRDIDFFICDITSPGQKIVVEEYFENLGLYMIPYGLNRIDVQIPKIQKLVPHSIGIHMMLDLLHRSRMHFPGMGLGFVKRMLDEAISHCQKRFVGSKSLLNYDQVQYRLARLQANFTICSALCARSNELAQLDHDLVSYGIEANSIKSVTADLMHESSQSLLQLVGAKGYKLTHIAGRATIDCRPFQIFEGSNDILYVQIFEAFLKLMKTAKEFNLFQFFKKYPLTTSAIDYIKELINFKVDNHLSQRKQVELGNMISRIISMGYVIKLGENGFRNDLINGALSMLKQEIIKMLNTYTFNNATVVIEQYEENSSWSKLSESSYTYKSQAPNLKFQIPKSTDK